MAEAETAILVDDEHGTTRLVALSQDAAGTLGPLVAAMPPWSAIPGYTAERMTAGLMRDDPCARRYCFERDGEPAGLAVIRPRWMLGPYLQTLAVLPAHQSHGIGGRFMAWFEQRARQERCRWLWLCSSVHNPRATRFYERCGFRGVAALPDLVADGSDEMLMRKRVG